MFGRGSFTLFRVRGIPVRAHWTLFLILPYLTLLFSTRFTGVAQLAGVDPRELSLPPLAWGLLVAIAMFASVLLHELAHTAVAVRSGGRVREITLMMLGGVSLVERMPGRRLMQGLMAAAGPALSLLLSALLLGVPRFLPLRGDARFALFYLGQLNLVIGLFNLLPAFPMDGGRILRSLLAWRTSPARATRIAAMVGRVVAVAMGLFGLWSGSLLLLLISFFVFAGAGVEAEGERLREALAGLRVRDVRPARLATARPGVSAVEVTAAMRESGEPRLLLVTATGEPVGLVHARDLRRVERVAPALPEEPLERALDRAKANGAAVLVVGAPDELGRVAVVGPAELERAMELPRPAALQPSEQR